jgi:Zn-dependent peptidase ImmA (M78 family)
MIVTFPEPANPDFKKLFMSIADKIGGIDKYSKKLENAKVVVCSLNPSISSSDDKLLTSGNTINMKDLMRYKATHIMIFPESFFLQLSNSTKEDIERCTITIVHEICHVILDHSTDTDKPMPRQIRDNIEREANKLEKTILEEIKEK